jgi:LmbE family N-acetylglucosaminyl deacetylase
MAVFPPDFATDAASLIVIAPHPDDDVLGCGALLASVAGRIPVDVVYVTDGAASHRGSPTYPPERLRAVREREAVCGLRRLGIDAAPRFLRWPDGLVPSASDRGAASLLDVLRACIPLGPVAVAAPWRRDPHADHRAVASLVDAVLADRPAATRIEYAVWLDVLGGGADAPRPDEGRTVAFDARPWRALKSAAISEHRSQLGHLITDAEWSFYLPDDLLASALGPVERFIVPHGVAV